MEDDSIRIFLIDTADDTPVEATDRDFADIIAAARIGNSGASGRADGALLATKTTTNGTFDAADTTLTSVTGDQAEECLVYKDDGVADASSPLVATYDTFASGMPVTPNGGNITAQYNASGLFSL